MSRKQRCCLRMESLYHDVVEQILERLPVRSLLRLKSVSKQWKSTIESKSFHKRQLMQQSGDPDVLMVSVCHDDDKNPGVKSLRRLELGDTSSVEIPTPWEKKKHYYVSNGSLDGLVCLYDYSDNGGFVFNPATRWSRPLPLCQLQENIISGSYQLKYAQYQLGFGKDKLTGTYKPVWLYNSPPEINLENATTCEVFDFNTNAWRYVTPAAPYRVVGGFPGPVYVDGSIHWFTECQETKILSFDLHTEAFQVVCRAPFANYEHARMIAMCNLDNRLCVSEMKWPNQVIWSLDSADKTWHQMFSIDLVVTSRWFDSHSCALVPLTLLDGMKNKEKKMLLFYSGLSSQTLAVLDPETKSYHLAFHDEATGFPVCYFQSLISIS